MSSGSGRIGARGCRRRLKFSPGPVASAMGARARSRSAMSATFEMPTEEPRLVKTTTSRIVVMARALPR